MEDDLLQEPEEDRPGREVIVMLAVFFEAGLAPLSLVLGWLFGHPPLEHFVWSMEDALLGSRWRPYPWCSCFWRCCAGRSGRSRGSRSSATTKSFRSWTRARGRKSRWSRCRPASARRCSFAASCRPRSVAGSGLPWGLVLASLLFGLFHPISLTYMIIAVDTRSLSRLGLDRRRQPAHGHGRPCALRLRRARLSAAHPSRPRERRLGRSDSSPRRDFAACRRYADALTRPDSIRERTRGCRTR